MSPEVLETHEPNNPGRPRDDAREQAILDAVLALVAEVGYERLTMDAVASRAKASKATIYRRWAGKEELVVDAMSCHVSTEAEAEDTGSLRGDLLWLVRTMATQLDGFDGHLMLGVAQAALSSPSLCEALERQTRAEKDRLPRIIVERAIARGELAPGTSHAIFGEVGPSVVVMRLISGQPLDEAFFTHLVDDVLLPAFLHQSSLSPTPPTEPRSQPPRSPEP